MSQDQPLTLYPIGKIRSPFRQKFGTPRQAALCREIKAKVVLEPQRVPEGALEGLEAFSNLWLIGHFHKSAPLHGRGKVQPPRLNGQKVGLFSSRSPHRPNPLSLTLVQLLDVDLNLRTLTVSGVDLIDQTPIMDIKPFIKAYDSTEDSFHGWVDQTPDETLAVVFEGSLQDLGDQEKRVIEHSLCRDLRNLEDKSKNDENKLNKCLIGNFDVGFVYRGETVVVVSLDSQPHSLD